MTPFTPPGSLSAPRFIAGVARPTIQPGSSSQVTLGAVSALANPVNTASHTTNRVGLPVDASSRGAANDPATSASATPLDAAESFATAVVIGLGLIGGSVARDLAARGVRVLGHDRDRDTVDAAMRAGIIAGALPDDLRGAETADVVILATPVDQSPVLLAALAALSSSARLITDVGSTKRSIVDAATALGLAPRFVGAHPLAGDHHWGWVASRCHLFQGARVYLCPARGSEADAVSLARSFWEMLGAVPVLLDATRHDALLACSSHLPQLAATALALTLSERGVKRTQLGTGGRDMTRLAGSSPVLWTAITRDNAGELEAALDTLMGRLTEMRTALRGDDRDRLLASFQAGLDWSAEAEQ